MIKTSLKSPLTTPLRSSLGDLIGDSTGVINVFPSVLTLSAPGISVAQNLGTVVLSKKQNQDGSFYLRPRLSRESVYRENALILGLGSSTLNGAGPTLTENQLRNRLTAWALANTNGTFITEMATGGFYTDMILPDANANGTTRLHDNVTAAGSLEPDIIFVMLPSNDPSNNTPEEYLANSRLIKEEGERRGAYVFYQDGQPRTAFDPITKAALIAGVDLINASFLPEDVLDTFYRFSKEAPNVGDIIDIYDSGDGVHLEDVAHGILLDIIVDKWKKKFRVSNIAAIEIERSLSVDSGFAVIETDATEYIPNDGTLIGELQNRIDSQEYFYRTRIRFEDGSYSPYSNVISNEMPALISLEDQVVQVNLTDVSTAVPGWNIFNQSTPAINDTFTNLLDSSGAATGIDLTLVNQGMTNDIGVTGGGHFPDLVIGESWEVNGNVTTVPQLRFDNLEADTSYNLEVITSDSNVQDILRTSIHVNGKAHGALSGGNDGSVTIEINNLIPVAGSLLIDMRAPVGHIGSVNGVILRRREKGVAVPFSEMTMADLGVSVFSAGVDVPLSEMTMTDLGVSVAEPFSKFINFGGVGTAPAVAGWESLGQENSVPPDAVEGWINTGNLAPDTDILFHQLDGIDITLENDGSGSSQWWGFTNVANGFAGNAGAITGDNSGVVPDDVSAHYIFVQARSARFHIDNLPTGTYEIRLFASRDAVGSRISDFTIGATTISLECEANTANEAVFTGVVESSGRITVTLGDGGGDTSAFAYVNAIKIIKE